MNKTANVKITSELKNPSEAGTYYRLLCMTGPNKGKVYYLVGKRVVIGRGEKADIQIGDTKISREHAELSFADKGYTITDLGAQNGIVVGDTKIKQKKLLDSEKVVIGATVFKYNIIEVAANELTAFEEKNDLALAKESKTNRPQISASKIQRNDPFAGSGSRVAQAKKGGPPKLLIFTLVIGGVMYVLFSDNNEPKQKGARSAANSRVDDFSMPIIKKVTVEDAEIKKKLEALIHSGRREFSEGNYFRAMEDFRLALLLSPNNGQASFYLSKAKQSLDDDIRKNFEKGKQEYEAKSYRAAVISYCGVVQLIQNYPNDERYKNAMLQISAIESELGLEKGEIKCLETKSAESKN